MRDFSRLYRLGLVATGLAMALAAAALADSPSTTEGLAAFSGGRYAEALSDWQRASNGGDGQAALYIGLLYDLGRGMARDPEAARAWYEKSAAQGNAVAMFNVGVLYDAGVGMPRNRPESLEWYKKAATARMGRAAYALGLIYESGDGVPPDRTEAVRYFREALAEGVTAARAHLASLGAQSPGAMHHGGAAGNPRQETGLAAFDRAQDLLLVRTPQATREAARLLHEAADKGDRLAAYDLAYCYEKGIGVQVDRQKAYVWYGRAVQSTIATVHRAAAAGMQAMARMLTQTELAAAKAAISDSDAVR